MLSHGLLGQYWGLFVEGLGLLIGFLHLACIPLVLSRRREPAVTLAWLLGLLLLPAAGVLLYWAFGRGVVRRSARGRQRLLASRLTERALSGVAAAPDEVRPLARAAWEVGRAELTGGNKLKVLVNATEAYPAKLEAIEGARQSIEAAYYIFRTDGTGRRFRDALVAAARRGVEVRVLLDAYGCWNVGDFFRPLLDAGGKCRRFLPFRPFQGWSLNLRNHRKILTIDGAVGFTGGINIGDEYLLGHPPRLQGWRDTHLRVEGPAASDLRTIFADDWVFITGERLRVAPRAPPLDGGSLVQILPSGPDDRAQPIHQVYFSAISTARRTLDLTTPYFIPDTSIAVALVSAALRGVRVRLLLPLRNNQRLTALASRSYCQELLEAGVEIYLYTPGMIHAKTMVIDDSWASIGTANLDVRSFRLNFEVTALLYGPAEIAKLGRCFEDDLGVAERLDPRKFRSRSIWRKAAEGGARLLSPIL